MYTNIIIIEMTGSTSAEITSNKTQRRILEIIRNAFRAKEKKRIIKHSTNSTKV